MLKITYRGPLKRVKAGGLWFDKGVAVEIPAGTEFLLDTMGQNVWGIQVDLPERPWQPVTITEDATAAPEVPAHVETTIARRAYHRRTRPE